MRFMPHENGVYYVNIKFNEAHIPGSPFPMLVGKLGADPALVFAKGEGLEKGEVGELSIILFFFTFICLFRSSSSTFVVAMVTLFFSSKKTVGELMNERVDV